MKNFKDTLAETSESTEEYQLRRWFYGYLLRIEEIPCEISDYEVNISDDFFPRYYPSGDHYQKDINLNNFNNIHRKIPPLDPNCKSIFNLLEDDFHKNY